MCDPHSPETETLEPPMFLWNSLRVPTRRYLLRCQLEKKLSSIEDRGQTVRVIMLANPNPYLWPWPSFLIPPSHDNDPYTYQKSRSKVRRFKSWVETDGPTRPSCSFSLTRSVTTVGSSPPRLKLTSSRRQVEGLSWRVSCGYRDAAADYSRRVTGLGTTIGRVRPSVYFHSSFKQTERFYASR